MQVFGVLQSMITNWKLSSLVIKVNKQPLGLVKYVRSEAQVNLKSVNSDVYDVSWKPTDSFCSSIATRMVVAEICALVNCGPNSTFFR